MREFEKIHFMIKPGNSLCRGPVVADWIKLTRKDEEVTCKHCIKIRRRILSGQPSHHKGKI